MMEEEQNDKLNAPERVDLNQSNLHPDDNQRSINQSSQGQLIEEA